MDEQANAPAGPMAVDSAAVVSETDAAHSSADEEGWLRHTHVRRHQRRLRANNSATNNTETSNDEDSDDDESTTKEAAGPGDLYCENMDDEDEAWVYKHMRSGKEELVHVRRHQQQQKRDGEEGLSSDREDVRENFASTAKSSSHEDGKDSNNPESTNEAPAQNKQLQQALLLKPRSSDAILSCPRCFNIVCMDCQQHERYANQYRAMFVMNIGVNWTKRMRWDDAVGGLKLYSATDGAGSGGDQDTAMQLDDAAGAAVVPQDALDRGAHNNDGEKEELYYSVHCSYCQWELAALDMKEEIYYFYGCIASA